MKRILKKATAVMAAVAFMAGGAFAQSKSDEVDELLKYIRQKTDYVDVGTFDRLASVGSEEAFEALQKSFSVLRTPSGQSRAFYAFRLFRGTEQQQAAIDLLLEAVLKDKKDVGSYAMRALQAFELDAQKELMTVLDKSKSSEYRARALKPLLMDWLDHPTAAALRMFLANYRIGMSGSRADGLAFLVRVDPDRSKSVFKEVLIDKRVHADAKSLILQAITEVPDPSWEPTLLSALDSNSERVQLEALRALESFKSKQHGERLLKLCKSKLPDLKFAAYAARTRLVGQDEEWLSEIRKLVKAKASVDRQIAAMLAGVLPRDQAMEYLTLLLQDPNLAVKTEALMAIGQLRRRDTVPLLIKRLEAETGAMNWRVQKMLEGLTAQPFGPSVVAWDRWWRNEGEDFVLPTPDEVEEILYERDVWGDGGGDTSAFYGLPIMSDRVAFILDTSGSMDAEYDTSPYGDLTDTGVSDEDAEKTTRLKVAQKQLIRSLEKLPDNVHFNIWFFDSAVRRWEKKLTKMAAKKRIDSIAFVRKQKPAGATAIYDALKSAFEDPQVDTIYLLSDGQPQGGSLNDPEVIRQRVHDWNRTRHITIHTISVGGEVSLLIWLAKDSGGEYILAD
jgi:HEAT repeat protein